MPETSELDAATARAITRLRADVDGFEHKALPSSALWEEGRRRRRRYRLMIGGVALVVGCGAIGVVGALARPGSTTGPEVFGTSTTTTDSARYACERIAGEGFLDYFDDGKGGSPTAEAAVRGMLGNEGAQLTLVKTYQGVTTVRMAAVRKDESVDALYTVGRFKRGWSVTETTYCVPAT